jgi:hypothetical protein
MMNKRPNHQFYSPNKGPSRFISVDEEQSAFGSSCLSHHQPPIKDPTTSNCLTLMSDLVEEINNNFVLNDPHFGQYWQAVLYSASVVPSGGPLLVTCGPEVIETG